MTPERFLREGFIVHMLIFVVLFLFHFARQGRMRSTSQLCQIYMSGCGSGESKVIVQIFTVTLAGI